MKQTIKTRLIVMTALFAALTYVAVRINIPLSNNRIIHFGDAIIYLAACILPTPYAMLSGAIGAGLADATTPGCIQWILPTVIIKSLLVLFFSSHSNKFLCKRNIAALFFAGITGLVGYCIAEGIIISLLGGSITINNFIVPLLHMPADAIQPIGSAILFVFIAIAFDVMKIKVYFSRQLRGELP